MVRNFFIAIIPHIGNDNSLGSSGRYVHVIDTHAVAGNHTAFLHLSNGIGTDRSSTGYHTVSILTRLGNFLLGGTLCQDHLSINFC